MKRGFKKFWAIGFIFMFCISMIVTGCKKEDKENQKASGDATEATTTETTTTDETKDTEENSKEEISSFKTEGQTLDVTIVTMQGYTQPDSWLEKRLEEKYNVNIEVLVLPGWSDGSAKVNLLMSDEGQRPDVIWWWGLANEFNQWVDAGLLTNIAPYMEKYTNMKDYFNPESLFYAAESDGSIYRIPGDVAEESCTTTILRKDWLDKLGLKEPTTLDEYVQVLRAFTFDDPDGNGVDDTYGFTGEGLSFRSFWPFFGGYGADPGNFTVKEDGSVVYGATQPEVKEALTVISELYAEGVIDPSVITQNNVDELLVSGNWGSMYRWIAYMNPSNSQINSLKANVEGAEITTIDPVTGPTGLRSDFHAGLSSWCYFAITNVCEDPERVFAMFDDMAETENWKEKIYGLEGEHYTYEDGIYVNLLADGQNEEENIGLGLFKDLFARKDGANITNTPEVVALFEEAIGFAQSIAKTRIEFKSADRPVWKEYGGELEALRDQYIYGIISGEKSIDEFDTFVETFYAAGGKLVEEEAAQLYEVQKLEHDAFMEGR